MNLYNWKSTRPTKCGCNCSCWPTIWAISSGRRCCLGQCVTGLSLTTLREKLIKIGAKVVRHSRRIIFQMAEVAVPRELFRAILLGIDRLRQPLGAGG